nr:hypothetical protein [Streptomyces sp. CMB-StM0423]
MSGIPAGGQDAHDEVAVGDQPAQLVVVGDQDGADVVVAHPAGDFRRRGQRATATGAAVMISWTC